VGIKRDTARVILVDPADRVLLFRFDRGWLTPGGGLDPGESVTAGAVRELREETGHRIDPAGLGPVVAICAGQWSTGDGVEFDAVDHYFFVRAASAEVDVSAHQEIERRVLSGHRWWPLDELTATTDAVFPSGLAGLLPRLLAGDLPAEPVRLPWVW
jgi:8-oxo-dGTP pyrophosphatase MutT (NUDIX family)